MAENYGEEPCEFGCCCFGCKLIGYLFFCYPMRKRAKIQILWGWLLTLAVASCLVLGTIIYAPDRPFATVTDIRPVTHNFNFLFCEEAEVTSTNLEFDAFVVSGELQTNENDWTVYKWDTALFVDSLAYNYFSFYFLSGSSMDVQHCSREFMTMYLFKSLENFKAWMDDSECESCYVSKRYITKNDECIYPRDFRKFAIDLNVEDDYFLVYACDSDTGAWIDFHVTLNRTSYDLSHSKQVCKGVLDCKIEIDGTDQTAVFRVNNYYDLGMFSHPQFTTTCVPKIWAYLVFHGIIVLIVGISSSCLIQKCCKEPNFVQHNLYSIHSSERSPLLRRLWLPTSDSSSALADAPPKYEDAVPEDKDLPSYSDVMAATANGSYISVSADSTTHAHGVVQLDNENRRYNHRRMSNDSPSSDTHVHLSNENGSYSHTCTIIANVANQQNPTQIIVENDPCSLVNTIPDIYQHTPAQTDNASGSVGQERLANDNPLFNHVNDSNEATAQYTGPITIHEAGRHTHHILSVAGSD